MDELHKLFLGLIALMIVFTIFFGTAVEIQKQNRVSLTAMTTD